MTLIICGIDSVVDVSGKGPIFVQFIVSNGASAGPHLAKTSL